MSPSNLFDYKVKVIIHNLGLKYKLSDQEIENIVKVQFELLKRTIESASFEERHYPTIALPNLGKFYFKMKSREWYENECKNIKSQEEGDNSGAGECKETQGVDE